MIEGESRPMNLELVLFDNHIVTRQTEYPFDVIVREVPTYVFVSLSRWIPPPLQHHEIYRSWAYGNDWRLVYVPGQTKLEAIFEGHLKSDGRIIAEGGFDDQVSSEVAGLFRSMGDRK